MKNLAPVEALDENRKIILLDKTKVTEQISLALKEFEKLEKIVEIKKENLSFKQELNLIFGEEELSPSSFEIFDKIAVINLKENQLKYMLEIG